MPEVVGVRFKRASPVYYFDPAGLELKINDSVVVETSKGLSLGRVVIAPKQVLVNEIAEPLKPVVRKTTPEDERRVEELVAQEQEALAKCEEAVKQFSLPMKLLRAEYNVDGSRLTVFFSSEQRVDFRELLKKLTGTLRTRVELRQVGARDEAKLIGGLGRCGRHLCCSCHLCSFESVSVKLAKEQNLPLNPTKISGLCGKLLCCLGYESAFYRSMKEAMPKVGQRVTTPTGEGKIVDSNLLRETVVVQLDNETTAEFPLAQVSKSDSVQPPPPPPPPPREPTRHEIRVAERAQGQAQGQGRPPERGRQQQQQGGDRGRRQGQPRTGGGQQGPRQEGRPGGRPAPAQQQRPPEGGRPQQRHSESTQLQRRPHELPAPRPDTPQSEGGTPRPPDTAGPDAS